MEKRLYLLICLLFLGVGLVQQLHAAPAKPLLMPNKQTLYQRVLTKPGALLFPQPQQGEGKATTPFNTYYIYARQALNGDTWLQLGHDRYGGVDGWAPEQDLIPWNQGLTVAFRDPIDTDRTLLFRDKESLKSLLDENNPDQYQKLYQEAVTGTLPADSPVIAIQPQAHVDILKDFYLVPIRDHEDVFIGGEQARMLQVSSVPLTHEENTQAQPEPASPAEIKEKPAKPAAMPQHPFRSGVVFVIDSTLSMDPYIDRTREAVQKIYDTITNEKLTGDVSFGLIAFRDDVKSAPGLEYRTRTFVNLSQGRDANTFFKQVKTLKAATVSSQGFNEDSYAGMHEAISNIDWEGQDARYVILITDAGPRVATDPLSGTGMSAQALRQLAQDKNIALSVLHLLTPAIYADHARAAEQYKDLSYYPGIGSFYYGVETGDVQRFGRVLDGFAHQITDQVKKVAIEVAKRQGQTPEIAKEVASSAEAAAQAESKTVEQDQLAQFQAKVEKLGYALRMRYLESGENHQIPDVFNAWLVDRDIKNPKQRTLDVRVLLTRDQLSDMHGILKQVLETAEEGLISPRGFLNDLKSLAATISRDPEQLGSTTRASGAAEGNLADMGFMREYIEDLPYTGEVMNLSLEHWQDWSAQEQINFIHRLEEKINYYQVLHDHTDLWVSLDGRGINGDSVFPIALEMLP